MTLKKPTATVTKMDMFVPSPGQINVTSPNTSIYENDRVDRNVYCRNTRPFSNPSVESALSEDMGNLDDKIEDSTLQNLLTPDVMNTLQAGLNSTSELFWSEKLENTPLHEGTDAFGANATLAQLNLEPDLSFVNDVLGLDQDDSKMGYSPLEFLCNEVNSSSCHSVSSNTADCSPINVMCPSDSTRRFTALGSSSVDHQKDLNNVGQTYVTSIGPVKHNFPPRASQPPLIGVVAPVKKTKEEKYISTNDNDECHKDLQSQSPNLHKLLCNPFSQTVKLEPHNSTKSTYTTLVEVPAQIVPSSGAPKRTSSGQIKQEPLSPGIEFRPMFKQELLVKEESTEEKWKDIENFIHNPDETHLMKKRRRFDSGSSSQISDDDDECSSSYGGKDEDGSDDEYSDIDADIVDMSPTECESLIAMGKKQKQYFWQYNVQSKGPKGTRLKLSVESPADPHVLNDFEDPVFDECNTSIAGIRHGGKARKGDGNEITPNPRKLFMIGHQLMKLNRQINACQLGSDVPTAKRNESRKEKNKLASRACRLKKKAQHEANKIKLYGLEQEHSQLNTVLRFIWPHIRDRAQVLLNQAKPFYPCSPLMTMIEENINQNYKNLIAGNTTDYVNSVILKVESGDNNGGLTIKKNRKT
ncbi:uncharacterized protein LOC131943141 isoform X2 [Physella acuta]|nr:uncharacterized protein LOC131943141 isoform X2 [Physella acuta]